MQRDLIFDIGCHNGEDADYYLKKGFRVVAVEANPHLCSKLKERFAEPISDGRMVLVEKAIADKSGADITFYIPDDKHTVWGTIDEGWRDRMLRMGITPTAATVPSITFTSLVTENGVPYYMKVDIEGADHLCLYGLSEIPRLPKYISFESEVPEPGEFVSNLWHLNSLGYNGFKIVDQARVPDQVQPIPPREGFAVDHQFPLGATGLFGEELPGEWMSKPAMLATFTKTILKHKVHGIARRTPWLNGWAERNIVGWYDVHARLGG